MRSPGIVQGRSGCLRQRLPAGGGLRRGSRVRRLRGRREAQWSPAWRAHHARACARDPLHHDRWGARPLARAVARTPFAWAIYEHCRLAYHADAWYACIAIQTTIGRGRTTTWGPITSLDRRADLAAFMDGDQAAAWRPAGWTGHEQSDFTCTKPRTIKQT